MKVIHVTPEMRSLPLGRVGENERTQFVFDVKDLAEEYPAAVFTLLNKKPKSYSAYECEITQPDENGQVAWTVTDEELTTDGEGCCQLQAKEGTAVARTKMWDTTVDEGLIAPEEEAGT